MTAIKSILRHLRSPVRNEAVNREVENELRFHLELRTRDNIAAGMSPEDAEADAMRRFGDIDRIQAVCEEIRKERLAGSMKVIKGVIYAMIGCGLTLKLVANLDQLRLVGHFLTIIGILWRLLIYLREMQPDQHRIEAAEQPALSITHTIGNFSASGVAEQPFNPARARDKKGRTPVERLLSDEE
ncbi:MAG TPA: permease prefix domain 1-containing protein [Blastocatellia bacterium]|nr:permease prefix domain 1-containing protein [Blastocatellia bacterium]